jgi:hypothetical protein
VFKGRASAATILSRSREKPGLDSSALSASSAVDIRRSATTWEQTKEE